MSGYLGNPDAESEHALILSENGIQSSREQLEGPVLMYCKNEECGEEIPEARRKFLESKGMRCEYCVNCQDLFVKPQQVQMLTKML